MTAFPGSLFFFLITLWSAPCHFLFLFHSLSLFYISDISNQHAQVLGGAVVNHPSGSQVNLPGCQMCRSGMLPGVKSPHYRPKAKPRKWMRLSLSLFPVPHDPLTLLCSLRILGWDKRPTFNQLHPHNRSFLQATKLLQSRNALMHLRPSQAFFAPSFLTLSKNHEDPEKWGMFDKVTEACFFRNTCQACTHIPRVLSCYNYTKIVLPTEL